MHKIKIMNLQEREIRKEGRKGKREEEKEED